MVQREDIKFSEKMKEVKPLFVFIFFAAVASILIINILVIPVTFFAVNFKSLFTKVTVVFCGLLIVLYIIRRITLLVSASKTEGVPVLSAFTASLKRRLKNIGYALTVLILSAGLFFIIYMVLSYNNLFINQMLK
jgi:hypothetical protein